MKLSDLNLVCVYNAHSSGGINGDAMVSVVGLFTPYIPFIPVYPCQLFC